MKSTLSVKEGQETEQEAPGIPPRAVLSSSRQFLGSSVSGRPSWYVKSNDIDHEILLLSSTSLRLHLCHV